jgi:hypothetical protein
MNPILHQLRREIAFSVDGLDVSQTQLRPPARPNSAETWSIQQIIEHLLLTYSETETALDARLAKHAPTRAKPNLLQRVSQYTVLRLGYFPPGRKAPPRVTPPAVSTPRSGDELAQAAAEHLTRLDSRCAEAHELFGPTSRCASHMVLGPLSVDQWRKFQLVHGEHHLKQIVAIRKTHGV